MKIKNFGRVCRNQSHKHIFAQHSRIIVNHYIKGRKIIRVTFCKNA